MSSPKFDALAASVGSTSLAGWITTHNPKVRARADATRARHKVKRKALDLMKGRRSTANY